MTPKDHDIEVRSTEKTTDVGKPETVEANLAQLVEETDVEKPTVVEVAISPQHSEAVDESWEVSQPSPGPVNDCRGSQPSWQVSEW